MFLMLAHNAYTSSPAVPDYIKRGTWCFVFGGGIIGALVVYGVLQERIMTTPYDGEMFGNSVFLVGLNRVVAVIYAASMVAYNGEPFENKAPFWKYLAISLSSVYASACQYEALKYVSFPVQMLGKSFKMMPVMLWGIVVSGKVYTMKDWGIAAAVTGGVTFFLMTGPITEESDEGDSSSSIYGLLLLLIFLGLDGFTSTFQEVLFKEHKTSKYNQMLFVNLGSTAISLITLVGAGELSSSIAFTAEHPSFAWDASILSVSAVCGQWFIYSMVKEFGALVFAATMNVRQLVSILVSYAMYGHVITFAQVFGLLMVFAALFYKSCDGMQLGSKDRGAATTDSSPSQKNGESPAVGVKSVADINGASGSTPVAANPQAAEDPKKV